MPNRHVSIDIGHSSTLDNISDDKQDDEPGSPELVYSFTMMQRDYRAETQHARRGAAAR